MSGFRSEASFRFQILAAGIATCSLFIAEAPLIWWAIMILAIAGVLMTELINTALEHALDRLHPEIHPQVKAAKDCAAGAVLIMCFAAALIAAVFIYSWRQGFKS